MNNYFPDEFAGATHTHIFSTFENRKTSVCSWRYTLPHEVVNSLAEKPSPFGEDAYRESTFLKNYSRLTTEPFVRPPREKAFYRQDAMERDHPDASNARKERWVDTCVRVIEGLFSHYIDHHKKNRKEFFIDSIDTFAVQMLDALFEMKWVPPGRGLYAMGTKHTYDNGNAALNNCYAVSTKEDLIKAAAWSMDMSMCGGGVGFSTEWRGKVIKPTSSFNFTIPDSRQGWVAALELLLRAYIPDEDGEISNPLPIFSYEKIRGYGEVIKGFGGTSSGPEPLRMLLVQVQHYLDTFLWYHKVFPTEVSRTSLDDHYLKMEAAFHLDFIDYLLDNNAYKRGMYQVRTLPEDRPLNFTVGCHFHPDECSRCSSCKTRCEKLMEVEGFNPSTPLGSEKFEKTYLGPVCDECKLCSVCKECKEFDKYQSLRENVYTSGLNAKKRKPYNHVRLILDIFNSSGECVVAGNVRRSAQIAIGNPDDEGFIEMKSWDLYPERCNIMSLSNNTLRLWKDVDFEKFLPIISTRIKTYGEPGICNMINIKKYARVHDERYGPDTGELLNPCAETILCSYEPCCLSSIIPYNCKDELEESKACQYATFYAMVVTTVPHHWNETNNIMSKNRRIGVSFGGVADLYAKVGYTGLIESFRRNYKSVRKFNNMYARKLGIPESIRTTVVKPEGTISIITGTSAGVHFPIVRHGERRIVFDNEDPVLKLLLEAGYEGEPSTKTDKNTYCIFPIKSNGSKTAQEATLMEKMFLAQCAQRNWADNSVSFTADFHYIKEANQVESCMAGFIQLMKAISMFPQYDVIPDQYKHIPFKEVSEESYLERKSRTSAVNWISVYDPHNERATEASKESVMYCTNDTCSLSL